MTRSHHIAAGGLWLWLVATSAFPQDLDPRAYATVPVGYTVAVAGFNFSSGGVLTDPTLPVVNVHAKVGTPSIGVAQSFNLFGRTAQALAVVRTPGHTLPVTSPNRPSTSTDRGSRTCGSVSPCWWLGRRR